MNSSAMATSDGESRSPRENEHAATQTREHEARP
jgi:hypothetical protein